MSSGYTNLIPLPDCGYYNKITKITRTDKTAELEEEVRSLKCSIDVLRDIVRFLHEEHHKRVRFEEQANGKFDFLRDEIKALIDREDTDDELQVCNAYEFLQQCPSLSPATSTS